MSIFRILRAKIPPFKTWLHDSFPRNLIRPSIEYSRLRDMHAGEFIPRSVTERASLNPTPPQPNLAQYRIHCKYIQEIYKVKLEHRKILHQLQAKVLCKPHFEKPHLVTERCETGKSKSAGISHYSKFTVCNSTFPYRKYVWIFAVYL